MPGNGTQGLCRPDKHFTTPHTPMDDQNLQFQPSAPQAQGTQKETGQGHVGRWEECCDTSLDRKRTLPSGAHSSGGDLHRSSQGDLSAAAWKGEGLTRPRPSLGCCYQLLAWEPMALLDVAAGRLPELQGRPHTCVHVCNTDWTP